MNKLSKKFKILVSMGLISLSLIFIGVGVSFYLKPEKQVNVTKLKKANLAKCEKAARAELYQTSSNDKGNPEITIFYRGLIEWKSRLYSSSYLLSSSCSDFELVDFCMGEKCMDTKTKREISGIHMQLKHKEVIVN
jgi:hypothetical protein